MPWTSLMLFALFGLIWGNRLLLDNRIRRIARTPNPTNSKAINDFKSLDAVRGTSLELTDLLGTYSEILRNDERDNKVDEKKDFLEPCLVESNQGPDLFNDLYKDSLANERINSNSNNGKTALAQNLQFFDEIQQDNDIVLKGKETEITEDNNEDDWNYFINYLLKPLKDPDFLTATTTALSSSSANENFGKDNNLQIDYDVPFVDSLQQPDIYADLLHEMKHEMKRSGNNVPIFGCDCKIKNDLLDLGQRHFPRYLLHAVCQTDNHLRNDQQNSAKCWRGSCKPLEYKVKVLTLRNGKDNHRDPALVWLPDDLKPSWKFKTVTVAAGCFCSMG